MNAAALSALSQSGSAWSAAQATDFMARLRSELRESGAFTGDAAGYCRRTLWVLLVTAIVWWAFIEIGHGPMRWAIALLAGYIGVQASAIGHEAGHGAVTRDRALAWRVGRFFMTWLVGASYSAWVERHGAHHLHPNSRKDPDVRPSLFNFNESDAAAAQGLAAWCTRHQHQLLIPLSSMMGFSLKLAGWKHVLRQPVVRWLDLALLMLHVAFWIALPAVWIGLGNALLNYALMTWVEGAYLAFVFLANHLGGPTLEEASAWPPALRQIVTARNLPNRPWLTHLCIGLNTHIEHHLFGHLPATRLPDARAITRRLCLSHGVPYQEYTVGQAFAEVQRCNRRMAEIAREAHRARHAARRKLSC